MSRFVLSTKCKVWWNINVFIKKTHTQKSNCRDNNVELVCNSLKYINLGAFIWLSQCQIEGRFSFLQNSPLLLSIIFQDQISVLKRLRNAWARILSYQAPFLWGSISCQAQLTMAPHGCQEQHPSMFVWITAVSTNSPSLIMGIIFKSIVNWINYSEM